MSDDVEAAIEKAHDYLGGLATPGRMSVEEAIEFYEGVQEDCRTAILGLRSDLGAEEGGT